METGTRLESLCVPEVSILMLVIVPEVSRGHMFSFVLGLT